MVHCDFIGSYLQHHWQHLSIRALFDADPQPGPVQHSPLAAPNFLSTSTDAAADSAVHCTQPTAMTHSDIGNYVGSFVISDFGICVRSKICSDVSKYFNPPKSGER